MSNISNTIVRALLELLGQAIAAISVAVCVSNTIYNLVFSTNSPQSR